MTPEAALERLFSAQQIDPAWFSPSVLAHATPAQLQAAIGGLGGLYGTFQSVTPAGNGSDAVQFTLGTVQVKVAIDTQGRFTAFGIVGVNYALAPDEQEITFTSDGDTLHGTLLVPSGAPPAPAALLIAGSGPTDRNGNSPLLPAPVNTLLSIARTLAGAGVASLRYDKFGAGKTGTAGHAGTDFTFTTFLDEVSSAYATLAARPEVDATRLMPAGHSEGGLFALLLTQQVQSTMPPSALLLAAPPGQRYLHELRRQLTAQFDAALAAQRLTPAEHDQLVADLESTIASIRASGTTPPGVFVAAPQLLASIFSPSNSAFLEQADSYDPAALAASLAPGLPVLIVHGALDMNINDNDIQDLLAGFQTGGNTTVQDDEFPDVNHELEQVPAGQSPATAATLAFSPDVAAAITDFATAIFG